LSINSIFGEYRTKITDTLHDDLHALLRANWLGEEYPTGPSIPARGIPLPFKKVKRQTLAKAPEILCYGKIF